MEKTEKTVAKKTEHEYFKGQILKSDKYAHRKDILGVLLEDGKMYTLSQVDMLLNRFMKGKVK